MIEFTFRGSSGILEGEPKGGIEKAWLEDPLITFTRAFPIRKINSVARESLYIHRLHFVRILRTSLCPATPLLLFVSFRRLIKWILHDLFNTVKISAIYSTSLFFYRFSFGVQYPLFIGIWSFWPIRVEVKFIRRRVSTHSCIKFPSLKILLILVYSNLPTNQWPLQISGLQDANSHIDQLFLRSLRKLV